jgi:hypothetical protein
MTVVERINYYAKGAIAIAGSVVVFAMSVVSATKDGNIDGGDISVLGASLTTLVVTVVGVIMKRNIDPSPNEER